MRWARASGARGEDGAARSEGRWASCEGGVRRSRRLGGAGPASASTQRLGELGLSARGPEWRRAERDGAEDRARERERRAGARAAELRVRAGKARGRARWTREREAAPVEAGLAGGQRRLRE